MWRTIGQHVGRTEEVWLQYPNLSTAQWAATLLNGRNLGAVWNIEAECRPFALTRHIRIFPTYSQLWLSGLPNTCNEINLRRWLQTERAVFLSVHFISKGNGQMTGNALVSVLNEEEATIISIKNHKRAWPTIANKIVDVIVIH
jgi:hypothetical protein